MDIDKLVANSRNFVEDLDKYRDEWESGAHWFARKSFLRLNWARFENKRRLICLSETWANIHFMGNKYPAEVMEEVKALEEGLEDADNLLLEAENQVTVGAEKKENCIDPYYKKLPRSFRPVFFIKSDTLYPEQLQNECSTVSAIEAAMKVDNSSATALLGTEDGKSAASSTSVNVVDNCVTNVSTNSSFTASAPLSPAMLFNKPVLAFKTVSSDDKNDHVVANNTQGTTSILSKLLPTSATTSKSPGFDVGDLTKQYQAISVENSTKGGSKKLKKQQSNRKNAAQQQHYQQPSFSNAEFCETEYKKEICTRKSQPNFSSSSLLSNISMSIRKTHYLTKMPLTQITNLLKKHLLKFEVTLEFSFDQVTHARIPFYAQWLQSCQISVPLQPNYWISEVYIQDIFISFAFGKSKFDAQAAACKEAVMTLKSNAFINCYKRVNQGRFIVWDMAVRPPVFKKSKKQDIHLIPIWNDTRVFTQVTQLPSNLPTKVAGSLSNFIIFQSSGMDALNCLNRSASMSKVSFERIYTEEETNFRCTLLVAGVAMGTGLSETRKRAASLAAEQALSEMSKKYPIIEDCHQDLRDGSSEAAISREELVGAGSKADKVIGDDNIGNQMLRKMGWSGAGGVGKSGAEGIAEPVTASGQQGREGLGQENVRKEKNMISFHDASRVIRQYIADGRNDEIYFSSELTSEERKMIHQLARSNGLKSRSYGKGEGRYLALSRKKTASQILEDLQQGGGGSGYRLVSNTAQADQT